MEKLLNEDEMDEKFGLPDTWARHSQKRIKQDNCQVCETPFGMVTFFGMGNRDFFCKHCGFAVCGACSRNSKYLSKDATEKYRVCDLCDTKLDNVRLKLIFEHLQQLKDSKLALLEKLIQSKKETYAKLKQQIEDEAEI